MTVTTDLWSPPDASTLVIEPDHLRAMVETLGNRALENQFSAFAFDLETRPGPTVWNQVDWDDPDDVKFHNTNPRTNEIYWCSFATTGMAFAVALGHPNGEQIGWQPAPLRKGTKSTKRVVPKFAPPPEQMLLGEFIDIVKPLFFNTDIRKVNHNVKFDLLSIAKYFGELPSPPYTDTLVMKSLAWEEPPHGLEFCVPREFGYKYDKIGKNLLAHPFSAAATYSYLDAKYTWLLLPRYYRMLCEEGLEEYFWFTCDVTDVLAHMEWTGAPVRGDEVGDLDVFLRGEMEVIKAELWAEAGRQFELTNPSDKGWFIFDHCNHTPFMVTPKKKEPSLAAEHLNAFTKDARVARLMEYGSLAKLHSTYVVNYQKYAHNGRIHTNYRQAGTVTGRFSCVSGSTLLPTSRGTFRFDQYQPIEGDLVRTHTGDLQQVLRKVYKGRDEMLRVLLSNGSVLECTQDHRLLTPAGWRRVGDLLSGDRVSSYVGVEVVRDGSTECGNSATPVLRGREANDGGRRPVRGDYLSQRALDHSESHGSTASQSRESAAVLALQDGGQEPDAWQEWCAAPQPQRRRARLARILEAQGQWALRASASVGDGGGGWCQATTGVDRGAPYRRGQTEQRAGQSRTGDAGRTPVFARQEVCVQQITPLGAMGVWDIEVAGDHSYLTQGFINHNSGEPNLQNVPKPDTEVGRRIRGLFWGGSDNDCLVVGDYSQIELRVLAHYSGDPTMCLAFENNEDIHQASADTLGTDRGIAKNINFAIPFGAGYKKVAAMGGGKFSESTAKKFFDLHHERFPRVWAFINKTKDECRRHKPHEIYTILGRKRRLPKIVLMKHPDEEKRQVGARAGRQAVNTKIQGSAADLIQKAMIRLYDTLDDDMHLILQVHDELVVITPRDKVDRCIALMREAMQGEEMQMLRVPVTANIAAVDRWSEAKA